MDGLADDGALAPPPRLAQVRRVALAEPCELESPQRQRGVVWNLSAGGVYVVLAAPPPEQTRLRIAFTLPYEVKPLRAEARVAWRNPPSAKRGCGAHASTLPPGCGMQFLVLDEHDLERIERQLRA